jgi:hypothetical protein
MKNSPYWGPKSPSARQEIARILWIQKVHLRFHHRKPLVLILNQIKLVHALSCFLKVHFNIILTFTPRFSKVFPRFSPSKPCMHFSSPPHVPLYRPYLYYWFDHPNNTRWEVKIMELLTMLFPAVPCYQNKVYVLKDSYIIKLIHLFMGHDTNAEFLKVSRKPYWPSLWA